jgi:hypothetical protein
MKKSTFKQYGMNALFTLVALVLAGGLVACDEKQLSASDKGEIQTAMNTYIQEKTSADGGAYLLDKQKVDFDYLHEGVKVKGDSYVSCADFKMGSDVYDLDYYVKKINGKLTVVKEVLHKKNGEKIDKVLWQE